VLRALPLVSLALIALSGCGLGSSDAGGGDSTDDRTAAQECLQRAGLETRFEGEEGNEELVIGGSPNAPRIKFFLTAGEAEAEQFQGRGEGAEQIGSAHLYVGDGSDEVLHEVELCLADL
jgi:hypothetical protein